MSASALIPHSGQHAFVLPTKRIAALTVEPGAEAALEYPWSATLLPVDYPTLRIVAVVNFEAGAKKYSATLFNDTMTFVPRAAGADATLGFYVLKALGLLVAVVALALLPAACGAARADGVASSWPALFGFDSWAACCARTASSALPQSPVASAGSATGRTPVSAAARVDDDDEDMPSIVKAKSAGKPKKH